MRNALRFQRIYSEQFPPLARRDAAECGKRSHLRFMGSLQMAWDGQPPWASFADSKAPFPGHVCRMVIFETRSLLLYVGTDRHGQTDGQTDKGIQKERGGQGGTETDGEIDRQGWTEEQR